MNQGDASPSSIQRKKTISSPGKKPIVTKKEREAQKQLVENVDKLKEELKATQDEINVLKESFSIVQEELADFNDTDPRTKFDKLQRRIMR